MGSSMMLGVILDAIMSGFMKIIQWLFQHIVQPVIDAVFTATIYVVKYSFAYVFYTISIFLLQLIDFVEAIFRSLAGLDNTSNSYMHISVNGGEGDLLIQLLRHQSVVDAFLACVIVGIFLLIITTIFQIIKSEYTTEGSQNSKTKIIGKSLKALTNLIVLPLLVILGVFIGNQVLGLIDNATRGEQKAKISGTLFATAASGAVWKDDATGTAMSILQTDWISYTVTTASVKGLTAGLDTMFDLNLTDEISENLYATDQNNPARIAEVESKVAAVTSGSEYWNPIAICRYIDKFEVNYLLLIFGSCMIIKSLYFCCFGMIDRLYRCVALFIISPLVIGMSPINEGNLGKWRSSFIGRALSAYGIIISMNLFFVIVQVFLQLDIQFKLNADNAPSLGLGFGPSLMRGLIKSIFVIVGCNMIAKLSGEMGQFFGATDALATGKEIEKDIKDSAKKAVSGIASVAMIAAGVATGGAAIAGKVALSAAKAGRVAQMGKAAATKGTAAQNYSNALSEIKTDKQKENFARYKELNNDFETKSNYFDELQKVDTSNMDTIELQRHNQALSDAKKDRDAADKARNMVGSRMTEKDRANFDAAISSEKAYEKASKEYTEISDEVQMDKTRERDKKISIGIAAQQFGRDSLEKINPLSKLQKKYTETRDKGLSQTEEGQAIKEDMDKQRAKGRETALENSSLGKLIKEKRDEQAAKIQQAVIEKAVKVKQESDLELAKAIQGLEKTLKERAKAEKEGNVAGIDAAKAMQTRYQNRIYDLTGQDLNISQDKTTKELKIENKADLKVDIDIENFRRNMSAAISKGASKKEIEQIFQAQLEEWGAKGNKKIIEEMKKILEEFKGTLGKG